MGAGGEQRVPPLRRRVCSGFGRNDSVFLGFGSIASVVGVPTCRKTRRVGAAGKVLGAGGEQRVPPLRRRVRSGFGRNDRVFLASALLCRRLRCPLVETAASGATGRCRSQNPHSNVAKGATLEWGIRRIFLFFLFLPLRLVGWLLGAAGYFVVPVHERALRVIAPGPDVEFEEGRDVETVGGWDEIEHLSVEHRRSVVIGGQPAG